MRDCNPHAPIDGRQELTVCQQSILCQRCSKCLTHCTCPPESERAASDEFVRTRKGSLVLKPERRKA